jgi:hypothetical protein
MNALVILDDFDQGSELWFQARAGIPTSSEFKTVMREGKEGSASVTRAKYLSQLAGEIITGDPAPEGYSNAFMERGKELEDEARDYFALKRNIEPHRVAFVRNDDMRAGCSPDSLIGDDSGLEIKVAIPAVQIERLQWNRLPPEHVAQVQGSMWITGRSSWSFVSYCPKLPPLILDVPRDEAKIAEIAKAVAAFNEELENLVTSIRAFQAQRARAA